MPAWVLHYTGNSKKNTKIGRESLPLSPMLFYNQTSQLTETESEMATAFEEAVRAAIQASGLTYTQLSREAKVDGTAIGRFMNRERGLNSETLGRILDKLGCTLTPVINRFAPKPVGRPRKCYAYEMETTGALKPAEIKTGEMVVEGIRDRDDEENADDSSAKGVSRSAKTGAS